MPLSFNSLTYTSALSNISIDKTPTCKTSELLYKLGLKHNRLGTFSYMVTATVSLFSTHQVTAPCHMQVIARKIYIKNIITTGQKNILHNINKHITSSDLQVQLFYHHKHLTQIHFKLSTIFLFFRTKTLPNSPDKSIKLIPLNQE